MDRDDTESQPRLLGRFGVDPNTETVWRLLIGNPTVSRDDLARMTGASHDDVERAVQELQLAGFARRSQSPAGITLIDPSVALESNVGSSERLLAEAFEELAKVRAHIPDLARDYARGLRRTTALSGVEIITELDDIRRQIYLSLDGCTKECLNLHASTSAEGLRDAEQIDAALAARGVQNRSIFAASTLENQQIFAGLEVSHARGELYRTLPNVPTRMLIQDRSLAVIAVDPTDMTSGAIFLRIPAIVDLLATLFEQLWTIGEPLFADPRDQSAPTDRTARVLELMSIGTTDEGIARALGIGVRTVRREIALIKSSLGVSSRAEVAAGAVRKGWL